MLLRVLVTDDVNGRSRAALSTVRALGRAGHSAVVSVSTSSSLAARSSHCCAVVRVPPPTAPGYMTALASAARGAGCQVVLPSSDQALLALGAPGASLVDKEHLAGAAQAAGLPYPRTTVVQDGRELLGVARDLTYPVVVKPVARGVGARPARRADGPADLMAWWDEAGPLAVQPWLDGEMAAVSGVLHDGRLLAVAHQRYLRTWPYPCGTASAAVTVAGDPALEERLLTLLRGHDGVFQVQLLGPWVIDVNPRVFGSIALAVHAGADLPGIAARAAVGQVSDAVTRARPGVRYRWLDGDVRAVVAGLRGRRLSPNDAAIALAPRRGTVHSIEAWDDMRPAAHRLLLAVRRR